MQKYYFIVYQWGGSKFNAWTDKSPMLWLLEEMESDHITKTVLLDYKEITETEYKLFKGE